MIRRTFDRQTVNCTHLFPTRYALELEGLKGVCGAETFKEPSQREDAKKTVKKLFEERYVSGKNKWFFQPLRVRPTLIISVSHKFNVLLFLRICSSELLRCEVTKTNSLRTNVAYVPMPAPSHAYALEPHFSFLH